MKPLESTTAQGSFPEHLLQVPGFVGEVVRYNLENAETPQPALALAAALSLQAVLSAGKVKDSRGHDTRMDIQGIASAGIGEDWPKYLSRAILLHAGMADLGREIVSTSDPSDMIIFYSNNEAWTRRRQWKRLPIPEPIIDFARWWGAYGGSGDNPATVVQHTEEASAVFDILAAAIEGETPTLMICGGMAYWTAAVEKAYSLALLYACSDRTGLTIAADAAGWACELSAYLARHSAWRLIKESMK